MAGPTTWLPYRPVRRRDRELREIVDLFEGAIRDRRSRLVSVTGIAGVGKSRLAWELGEQLEARPGLMSWHAGRAPAYGDEITFAAVAEMVHRRLRVPDGADAELARRRLGSAIGEFVGDEDERRWMEPRLAVLLGGDGLATFDRDGSLRPGVASSSASPMRRRRCSYSRTCNGPMRACSTSWSTSGPGRAIMRS